VRSTKLITKQKFTTSHPANTFIHWEGTSSGRYYVGVNGHNSDTVHLKSEKQHICMVVNGVVVNIATEFWSAHISWACNVCTSFRIPNKQARKEQGSGYRPQTSVWV